jgi:hypothetical protein
MTEAEIIEHLIQHGLEVSIQPERRTNEWLGVNAILYSVAVWAHGERVCGSIHRLLIQALTDVYLEASEHTP